MKLVFISGPIRAGNAWDRELNIRKAEALALEVWKAGFAVHCPHTQGRNYDGTMDEDNYIVGDLEVLKRCDAVLLVEGWERSIGTLKEVRASSLWGIPTFDSVEALISWRDGGESCGISRSG